MRLAVVCPHFEPDVAPTGAVAARIVGELGARGHTVDVFTSLPWYRDHRVEQGFEGRLIRREDTPWGRIVRFHPFPTSNKRNVLKRAAAFAGFSTLATAGGVRGGRVDGVLAMSPPLTLGLTGLAVARARKGPLVFNVQDIYPDVAVQLGYLNSPRLIAAARRLERYCYDHADAVTVLSEDLRANVAAKTRRPHRIHVIPNFVDTVWIRPEEADNGYREEFGLVGKTVVMYAGNVGLSQSLDLVLHAAGTLAGRDDVAFVINGSGAARSDLERAAGSLGNVTFVDMQPSERLPEVLAAGDIHVVPLRRGLASASVPSKTYSILAAGRPLIASVDEGSEVARIVDRSGAGIAVPPGAPDAFAAAVEKLVEAPEAAKAMGAAGRKWVEDWASPAAVAESYEHLFRALQESS